MLHPRQVEFEAGERLTQFVVQLARDTRTFLLTDGLESGGKGPQLFARLGDLLRRPVTISDVPLNSHVADQGAVGTG